MRKVKSASGATAVQIAHKQKGQIIKLIHIGSALSEEELNILLELADEQLWGVQLGLFPEVQPSLRVKMKQSFSALLWKALREQYAQVGFIKLDDDVFDALCINRIVEPTSKLDGLQVLADLGVGPIDQNKLCRYLEKSNKPELSETYQPDFFRLHSRPWSHSTIVRCHNFVLRGSKRRWISKTGNK